MFAHLPIHYARDRNGHTRALRLSLLLSTCGGSDPTTRGCMATAGQLILPPLGTSRGHDWAATVTGTQHKQQVKIPFNIYTWQETWGSVWHLMVTKLLSEEAGVLPLLSVISKKYNLVAKAK